MMPLGDPKIGCDPQTEFDCGSDGKMCIPMERVCNRKNDCGNWVSINEKFREINFTKNFAKSISRKKLLFFIGR